MSQRERFEAWADAQRFGTQKALDGSDSYEYLPTNYAWAAWKEAERQMTADDGMAQCMKMVRQELIEAGVIDKAVPPMMISNAVCQAMRRAVLEEREACAKLCDEMRVPAGMYYENAEAHDGMARSCAECIRARGDK